jgi:hypothetical protein
VAKEPEGKIVEWGLMPLEQESKARGVFTPDRPDELRIAYQFDLLLLCHSSHHVRRMHRAGKKLEVQVGPILSGSLSFSISLVQVVAFRASSLWIVQSHTETLDPEVKQYFARPRQLVQFGGAEPG